MSATFMHILIVEDDAGLAQLFQEELCRQGIQCDTVATACACSSWLERQATDLLLLDYALPDMAGTGLIEQLKRADRLPPFIVITGHGDERVAVQLMKQGALDYLVKDAMLLERLPAVVGRVLRELAQERGLAAAERALHASERRFREVLENVRLVAVELDLDGRITFCNDYLVQLTGWPRDEVLGQNWFERFLPVGERAAARALHIESLQGTSPPLHHESRIQTRQGELRDVRWHNTAQRDGQARITGTVSLGEDITERKQAEAEIVRLNACLEQRVQQRTAQLEAANQELESFSYSVSHDLRAPLRAIDGYARMLHDDLRDRLEDEDRRKLQIVCSEARRMGQLIDDLLRFSRLSRQSITVTDVDMTALVREVDNRLRQPASKRVVDFRLSPLPEALGDQSLLRQVWHNLIDNALKYTRTQPRAVIEVRGATVGEEVVYSIQDNGVGFDMAYADKLFGVFQRLHSQSEFEGTGVGLALVQRIVVHHGGRIWAEAEPNRGATFHFALPVGKPVGDA
jgi:PAS domain S-box-containing protein